MINTELFKILKGFRYHVKLFDVTGRGPILDPENATYIISKSDDKKSVTIKLPEDSSSEYQEVVVYVSALKPLNFFSLFKALKNLVNSYGITLTVREFNREIKPKDFSYLAKIHNEKLKKQEENINEACKYAHSGSTKSSYHLNPSNKKARIIIRHNKKINEEIRGARSRNVKAIFVEDNNGERRQIPTISLIAAKALSEYINNGGILYDDISSKVINLTSSIDTLKKYRKTINVENSILNEFVLTLIKSCRIVFEGIASKKHSEFLKLLDVDENSKNKMHSFIVAVDKTIPDDIVNIISELAVINANVKKYFSTIKS